MFKIKVFKKYNIMQIKNKNFSKLLKILKKMSFNFKFRLKLIIFRTLKQENIQIWIIKYKTFHLQLYRMSNISKIEELNRCLTWKKMFLLNKNQKWQSYKKNQGKRYVQINLKSSQVSQDNNQRVNKHNNVSTV